MHLQTDWISGSDSSDSENQPPGDADEELRRATLVELLEERAAYRAADRGHAYGQALIRELGMRVGVRCHRVECALRPGKICGLAFHRFNVTKHGNRFANVFDWQRSAILQAVAASTKLSPTLQLAFDIDQGAGYQHWAYRAHCNGSATAHGIRITTVRLPHAPGDISPATRAKLLDLMATRATHTPGRISPATRTKLLDLMATQAAGRIPVLVTPERRRQARPRQVGQRQHANAESANVAIRLLRLANLLPQKKLSEGRRSGEGREA